MSTHPDVAMLEQAISLQAGYIVDLRDAVEKLAERRSPDAMTAAFAAAIRQVRDEPATEELFIRWSKKFHEDPATTKTTYDGLRNHARRGFFEWIGERFFLSLTTIILSVVLAWAFVTGKFSK